jgi:hypothetical protein
MSRPEFLEPKPISPNISIKFKDYDPSSERRKPMCPPQLGSILGKRKLEVAFGCGMNDRERYGQEISPEFFTLNQGHNVFPSSIPNNYVIHSNKLYEDKLKYWREKYTVKSL